MAPAPLGGDRRCRSSGAGHTSSNTRSSTSRSRTRGFRGRREVVAKLASWFASYLAFAVVTVKWMNRNRASALGPSPWSEPGQAIGVASTAAASRFRWGCPSMGEREAGGRPRWIDCGSTGYAKRWSTTAGTRCTRLSFAASTGGRRSPLRGPRPQWLRGLTRRRRRLRHQPQRPERKLSVAKTRILGEHPSAYLSSPNLGKRGRPGGLRGR